MVKELRRDGDTYYVCEVCGFAYRERQWAERCQAWCEQHEGSCNLEIIQHGQPAAELE